MQERCDHEHFVLTVAEIRVNPVNSAGGHRVPNETSST